MENEDRKVILYTPKDVNLLINLWKSEFSEPLVCVILYQVFNCRDLSMIIQWDPNGILKQFCEALFEDVKTGMKIIFKTKLEEMPLLINHSHKYIQVIARWRLTVGR